MKTKNISIKKKAKPIIKKKAKPIIKKKAKSTIKKKAKPIIKKKIKTPIKKKIKPTIKKKAKYVKKEKVIYTKLAKNVYEKKHKKGYYKGHFTERFTKLYLLDTQRFVSKKVILKNMNLSNATLNKIIKGKKVSKKTYRKLNNFFDKHLDISKSYFYISILNDINNKKWNKKELLKKLNNLKRLKEIDKYITKVKKTKDLNFISIYRGSYGK